MTVIFPCQGSVYEEKPVSAIHVLNGYGKTTGTVQIEEIGCLEFANSADEYVKCKGSVLTR